MSGTWHATPGDTPVTDVPADYYPPGCGGWFEIPDGRDAGKRLFVRDSVHGDATDAPPGDDRSFGGTGATASDEFDGEATVVLIHGNPECSYTYRNVVTELAARADRRFRVVAPDHLGFGLSDTADYEMLPLDHARNLEHLIDELALTNVTLVVHDWGGPAGVGAFLRAPERVSNLVITNSTVSPIPEECLAYTDYPSTVLPWASVPDVIPDALWGELAAYVNFRSPCSAPRLYAGLAGYTAARRFGWVPDEAPDAHRVYTQQFRDSGNVAASKRLVRQTPHWAEGNVFVDPEIGYRDTNAFYDDIQHTLGEAWGPAGQEIGVRAVVGRWDPTGKPGVVDTWRDALPQLSGHVTAFEDVGHFVEEARPGAVATAIADVADL